MHGLGPDGCCFGMMGCCGGLLLRLVGTFVCDDKMGRDEKGV